MFVGSIHYRGIKSNTHFLLAICAAVARFGVSLLLLFISPAPSNPVSFVPCTSGLRFNIHASTSPTSLEPRRWQSKGEEGTRCLWRMHDRDPRVQQPRKHAQGVAAVGGLQDSRCRDASDVASGRLRKQRAKGTRPTDSLAPSKTTVC